MLYFYEIKGAGKNFRNLAYSVPRRLKPRSSILQTFKTQIVQMPSGLATKNSDPSMTDLSVATKYQLNTDRP